MKIQLRLLEHSLLLLSLLAWFGPSAQAADIERPMILVATDRLVGSPYEQTVLLVAPAGERQHLGLIVNRPTEIDLATVFPEFVSQPVRDPVFFGGPAMRGLLFAGLRAAEAPSDYCVSLMPGLFLVMDKTTVEALIKSSPNTAPYFVGVVVWGTDELEEEIRSGMWDVQPAEADVMFRQNPQRIWLDLTRVKRLLAANY